MRICIIDDNVMVLDALVLLLRDGGHEVFAAENAQEGLSTIEGTLPDFVLVDFDLPGMKGDALAREIRARHPALPIVLTSGQSAPPIGSIGAPGADVFLSKPFTPNILLACLSRLKATREEAA